MVILLIVFLVDALRYSCFRGKLWFKYALELIYPDTFLLHFLVRL